MTLIKSGEFLMGSPRNEEGHNADEKINRVQIFNLFGSKLERLPLKNGILLSELSEERKSNFSVSFNTRIY